MRIQSASVKRVIVLVAVLVGACTGVQLGADEVLGHPGLGLQIRNFYERNALEKQATCTTPVMQRITAATVVEDRGDRIVARIRYAWYDPGQVNDGGAFVIGARCQGFDERLFTIALDGDRTRVLEMTGPQQGRPTG